GRRRLRRSGRTGVALRTVVERGAWSVEPGLFGRFQLREVALRVAVVPELFLEDGVDALLHGVRAVLEHVDRSCEIGRRNRCEIVAKARGAIRAHEESF